MKVLLVAPIHNYAGFVAQYRKDRNIEFPDNQWHFFWVRAIRKLGHNIDVFTYTDFPFLSSYTSSKIHSFFITHMHKLYKVIDRFFYLFPYLSINNFFRNYLLYREARCSRYDILIFSWWTTKIFPIVLKKIQQSGTKIVFMYGMSPLIYGNTFEKEFAKQWDYIFSNDKIHATEWFMLWQNNSVCLPISSIEEELYDDSITFDSREYDITFIGRISPFYAYEKRIQTLLALQAKFPDKLHIWSDDVDILEENGLMKSYRGKTQGKEMFDILKNSKISINDHGNAMPGWWNMRTFEICWSWALQVVDFNNDDSFIDKEHLVVFSTIEDLCTQVEYYLHNDTERLSIAKKGYEHVYKKHTYTQHFKKFFSLVSEEL